MTETVTINGTVQPCDTTPPVITSTISPSPNANGWNNSDVTVSWTVSDPESGIASSSGCGPITLTTETAGTTLTCSATNGAGLSNSVSVTVKIDKTKPNSPTASISPAPNANGWNNSTPVTVSFTPTGDAGSVQSGIASCTAPVSLTTETAGTPVSGTCTDNAGNTSDPTTVTVKIDKTPPSITASATAGGNPYSAGTWTNQDVIVSFTCSDSLAGVASLSPSTPQTVSTEGDNQSVSGTCTDKAGNSASTSFGPIRIDKTPPSAAPTQNPPANSHGWNNTDVTVTWNWSDTLSGLNTATCPSSSTSSGEGTITLSATCQDQAGNQGSASYTVKVDKTPPTVTHDSSLDTCSQPGTNGWCRGTQTAGFQATDATSGVASPCTAAPGASCTFTQSTSTEGNAVSIPSGQVCDLAGNCHSGVSAGPYKIDATPPTITLASRTPAPNTHGWNNTDVTLTWNCSDSLSGVVQPSVSQTLSTEGANQSATGTCQDQAGNTASNTQTGINIDKTPPTLGSCPTADPFLLGSGPQTVGPIFASDALSGLNTGASTLTGTVDTSSVGTKTVTFTAVDNAGNTATKACSYSVIYNFDGFFQPVDNPGSSNPPVFNRVKAGSAIPVKFSLHGYQGLNIFATGSPASVQIDCSTSAPTTDIEQTVVTAGGSSLSYDPTTDQYIYVWKTDKSWGGTCRKLIVKLNDGTEHIAYFTFTR